ncbi:hypothetical protein ACWKX5_06580 [Enterobacter asburiae]
MHHEFAIESYSAFCDKNPDGADYNFIKHWCLEPEMLAFALENCDDKVVDIITTIKGITGYRKPTDKQKAAIALGMLNNRTAIEILLAVYGEKVAGLLRSAETPETADVVETELASHGIELSHKRIAFGVLSDFVADDNDAKKGNTYRATKAAVREISSEIARGTVPVLATMVVDEIVVVTLDELAKLSQPESDALRFSAGPMELERYIELNFGGNHSAFASAMGVNKSKISEWKKLGWIAYDGALWSSKRTLSNGKDNVKMLDLP